MTPEQPSTRPYGRRAFLGVVAAGLSALVWARPATHALSRLLPSEVRALAPSGGWRIYTIGDTMPRFDPATWRLRIDGLVERPQELGYRDLLALPRREQVSDFHCVTGWSVRNVRWAGVGFADLLARAQPLAQAGALRFESAEVPYEDTLTLAQARLPDAMLAYELDGRPLTRAHGAPVRGVVPEMYGYKNVKWVRRIELVAHPVDGFWEKLGYDRDAWVGRSNHA